MGRSLYYFYGILFFFSCIDDGVVYGIIGVVFMEYVFWGEPDEVEGVFEDDEVTVVESDFIGFHDCLVELFESFLDEGYFLKVIVK